VVLRRLVLLGAITLSVGCASHGASTPLSTRAAAPAAAPSALGVAVSLPPVTDAVAMAAPEPAAAPEPTAVETAPAPPPPPAPAPGSITVHYEPADGSTATATIDGPSGSHSKSLDSGPATFHGLAAGTYQVTITIDSADSTDPADGAAIGSARQILNGGSVDVADGDHVVVSCDDSGCG
jgi:hypothetical protein